MATPGPVPLWRLTRSIALMVASGGTPAQARRLVLANGLVLGSVASALGVVLGLGAGAVAMPVLQRFSDSVFGPYDVPWWTVVAVACFGLLSALLAAVVPAWIASQQDVVAVLAGRRGDRPPSTRSPVLGAALLGVGVAIAAYGAVSGGSEILIGVAAVLAVFGMILLVPLVLASLARVSGRLPLSGRYAVRDAARHRTRTVPAVAAVAATVAGVVTLGIGGSSDQAEARETYAPSLPSGVGVVTAYEPDVDWAALSMVVRTRQPGATVSELGGIAEVVDPEADSYAYATVRRPGSADPALSSYGSTFGPFVVSDGALPGGLALVPADRAAEAEQILAAGGMVAFAHDPSGTDEAEIVVEKSAADTGEILGTDRVAVPALWLAPTRESTPMAVLSPEAAAQAGLLVETTALVLTGASVTPGQESDISEALAVASETAGIYVERGFERDQGWLVVLLILGGLAGVLMLGGTLTATFLGLSDARPDLATLAAVGASPRSRRGVAAWFALVVGFVGAVLGAMVGFIPGVAITYPLTTVDQSGPYLDVPWLLIVSLVVALPLLTALIVGLTVRSRLPMVARLD